MTDIELEKILLIIVVVQTAEETGCLPLVTSTIHGRNDFLTFVAQAIGQIHLQTRLIQDTITLQTEFVFLNCSAWKPPITWKLCFLAREKLYSV